MHINTLHDIAGSVRGHNTPCAFLLMYSMAVLAFSEVLSYHPVLIVGSVTGAKKKQTANKAALHISFLWQLWHNNKKSLPVFSSLRCTPRHSLAHFTLSPCLSFNSMLTRHSPPSPLFLSTGEWRHQQIHGRDQGAQRPVLSLSLSISFSLSLSVSSSFLFHVWCRSSV